MSDKEEKDPLFTLPTTYVLEQLQKTDEQLLVTQSLLQHFFDDETKYFWLIPFVVEILWSNFGIVKALTPHLEDPALFDNPDTGEKEYMISETTLMNLQSLMIHRFYANRELNQLSFSTGLH